MRDHLMSRARGAVPNYSNNIFTIFQLKEENKPEAKTSDSEKTTFKEDRLEVSVKQ